MAARRSNFDPFGLVEIAVEQFGLNPNDITRIEARVEGNNLPSLIVTLVYVPKVEEPQT